MGCMGLGHYIDIITLSETWLNMNDNDLSFNIPGFQKMIRSDRNAQHGGGVHTSYLLTALACGLKLSLTAKGW